MGADHGADHRAHNSSGEGTWQKGQRWIGEVLEELKYCQHGSVSVDLVDLGRTGAKGVAVGQQGGVWLALRITPARWALTHPYRAQQRGILPYPKGTLPGCRGGDISGNERAIEQHNALGCRYRLTQIVAAHHNCGAPARQGGAQPEQVFGGGSVYSGEGLIQNQQLWFPSQRSGY